MRMLATALRAAIGKTRDHFQLSVLLRAHGVVAAAQRQAVTPQRDLAILISRIPWVRDRECALTPTIKEASQLLSWDRAGLVVAAALLEPTCAGTGPS